MKDSTQVFATNLRRYRALRDITQAQLAEAVGVSTNYLSLVESAKRFPSPKVMDQLAERLRVQPYEFLIDLETVGTVDNALSSTVQAFLADLALQIVAFSKTLK